MVVHFPTGANTTLLNTTLGRRGLKQIKVTRICHHVLILSWIESPCENNYDGAVSEAPKIVSITSVSDVHCPLAPAPSSLYQAEMC